MHVAQLKQRGILNCFGQNRAELLDFHVLGILSEHEKPKASGREELQILYYTLDTIKKNIMNSYLIAR